eukprot:gene31768-38398_t
MGSFASRTTNRRIDPTTCDDAFPKLGVKLSVFEEFIENYGGEEAFEGLTTTDVCETILKPITAPNNCSYCDILMAAQHLGVGVANVFISHAWKYKFLDVLEALKYHFQDQPDIIVWFDLFSNNQHGTGSRDFNWWCNTFKSAIADFGHVVMVLAPWQDPIPLRRAWCLFELYCSIECKVKFEVAMSLSEQLAFLNKIIKNSSGEVNAMLSIINCEKSESFNPDDKEKIFDVVNRSVGFDGVNSMVFNKMLDWIVDTTSAHMRGEQEEVRKLELQDALGMLYTEQGKYDKAEPLLVTCLERRAVVLGADHLDTLRATTHLAAVYDSQGQCDKAEPLYATCFEKRAAILGADHPDTLISLNNLGVEKHTAILGADHPNTLNSVASLAYLYLNQCRYDEAEPLYLSFLQKHTATQGANHLGTITATSNLADLYESQGKYSQAEPLYVSCLGKRSIILGADHPDTLESMFILAAFYRRQGKHSKAEPLLVSCLEKRAATLGADHRDTLRTITMLADVFERQGKHGKAQALKAKYKK